jgi:drug/metabolite transporter (DMT)-like permease
VPVLARVAFEGGSNAPTSAFVRFGLAGLLLWLILLSRRRVTRLPARRVAGLLLMGLLFCAGTTASFMAVERIPAALVSLVFYIYPAVVTLGSALVFKTRLSAARLVVLVAVLLGCALTVDARDGSLDALGVALALLTALTYAAYILVGSRVTRGVPAQTAAAWIISAAAGLMLLVGLTGLLGDHLTADIVGRGWLALLALALFSSVISIAAFLAAIARIDLFRATIISTVEPLISVVLAAALLDERLTIRQALGGAVIIVAALALQLIARRERVDGGAG